MGRSRAYQAMVCGSKICRSLKHLADVPEPPNSSRRPRMLVNVMPVATQSGEGVQRQSLSALRTRSRTSFTTLMPST